MNYTMTCLRTKLDYIYFFTRSVQINVLFMDLHILAKKVLPINNVNVTSSGQLVPMCLSLNDSGRETVQITHK